MNEEAKPLPVSVDESRRIAMQYLSDADQAIEHRVDTVRARRNGRLALILLAASGSAQCILAVVLYPYDKDVPTLAVTGLLTLAASLVFMALDVPSASDLFFEKKQRAKLRASQAKDSLYVNAGLILEAIGQLERFQAWHAQWQEAVAEKLLPSDAPQAERHLRVIELASSAIAAAGQDLNRAAERKKRRDVFMGRLARTKIPDYAAFAEVMEKLGCPIAAEAMPSLEDTLELEASLDEFSRELQGEPVAPPPRK